MIEVAGHRSCTPDELGPVLSGVRDRASWLPPVDAVQPVEPERPDEVGASYVVDQPGLPRATWPITEWEPGRSFAWTSRSTAVVSIGRHEMLPGDRAGGSGGEADGTTIRLALEWTGPLAGLVGLLVGRKTRHDVTREAEALDRAGRRAAG